MKYFCVLMIAGVLLGCKKNSPVDQTETPTLLTGDYYPVNHSQVWTYATNGLSDSGKANTTFEITIDTSGYRNGVFLSLVGRFPGETKWNHLFAIKDSEGIVYSIGDNPPETPFPLFKHQYLSTEITRETVQAGGTTYEAIKVNFNVANGRHSICWLVKGIGLVKVSSHQGVSLFSDENTGKDVFIETTLQSIN